MSQFNVQRNAVNADQIYYDVVVSNFQSTTTIPPIFYFNEQRTLPFITNPEDYYLSILRFTMETGTLPVFIPSCAPLSPTVNTTIYSVCLNWTDIATATLYTSGQVFIQWNPQDRSATVPPAPAVAQNGVQDITTGYYNCYSYAYWCYLVTEALATAYNQLNVAVIAGGAVLPSAYPPLFNWDTSAQSAFLLADRAGYSTNNGLVVNPSCIQIYFNAPLFNLFNSFPSVYLGYIGVTDGRNNLLSVIDIGGSNFQIITPNYLFPLVTYTALPVYQEYSTISAWTPIVSIVFTSNTLPIQPSQVSTPLVYNNDQKIILGGNNSAISNVITDLVSDSGNYRPNLVYNPTAQYRLTTLYGNRPLYNLDLQIFYKLKTGQLVPFRLGSGEVVSVKIAFLKKDLYANQTSTDPFSNFNPVHTK